MEQTKTQPKLQLAASNGKLTQAGKQRENCFDDSLGYKLVDRPCRYLVALSGHKKTPAIELAARQPDSADVKAAKG